MEPAALHRKAYNFVLAKNGYFFRNFLYLRNPYTIEPILFRTSDNQDESLPKDLVNDEGIIANMVSQWQVPSILCYYLNVIAVFSQEQYFMWKTRKDYGETICFSFSDQSSISNM